MRILLVLLLCFLPKAALAFEKQSIRVGYIDLPPFSYQQEGEPRGIINDLAKDVLLTLGLDATFVQLPSSRHFKQLETGKIQLGFGPANLRSLESTTYQTQAFALVPLYLFSNHQSPVQKMQSLQDERLVIVAGFTYGGFLGSAIRAQQNITLLPAFDYLHAFKLMTNGRASYTLNYYFPSEHSPAELAAINALTRIHVQDIGAVFYVSKNAAEAQSLLQRINALLSNNPQVRQRLNALQVAHKTAKE